MSEVSTDLVRQLVAEAVREVAASLRGSAAAGNPTPETRTTPGSELVTRDGPRRRSVDVRLGNDQDVARFVAQLLSLFENPKTREDLRNGWLRFSLVGGPTQVGPAPGTGSIRLDRGVLTERQVAQAAEQGRHISLGKGVVVTPLARDRARALDVHIHKEQQ